MLRRSPGGGGGVGEYSWEFLVGGVPPGRSNPQPDFRPNNAISHTLFQTSPLKSVPVFRPGL